MASQRAYYTKEIATFLTDDPAAVLGQLACGQAGDLTPAQRNAWVQQIELLHAALPGLPDGMILFEYLIPRMGKRVDNILLVGHTVLVIEFKVGATSYDRSAINQAIDYALDLKNFHAGSRSTTIVPILAASKAPTELRQPVVAPDDVADVMRANARLCRKTSFRCHPEVSLNECHADHAGKVLCGFLEA